MPARQKQTLSDRSRRTLRSQSREVADSDAENRASRPSTKKRSRRNDLDEPDLAEGTPPSAQPDLSAVDEEVEEDVNSASNEIRPGRSSRKNLGQTVADGPQDQSLLSGTTARASESERDLQQPTLDTTLIEPLPDLWEASGKVLNFLPAQRVAIPTLRDSIQDAIVSQAEKRPPQDPRSLAEYRSLVRNRGMLEATLKDCLPNESSTVFVDTPAILENTYGPELAATFSDQDASPDLIFRMANLATVTSNALTYPYKSADSFLEDLDASFPGAFSPISYDDTTPDKQESSRALLDLAIDVRTQCTISQIEKHVERNNFDQDEIIRQIFFEAGDDLRDWNWREFRVATGTTDMQMQIQERLLEIQSLVSQMSQKHKKKAALDRLKARFPWSTFSESLLSWVADEAFDNKSEIEELGGRELLQQRMQDIVGANSPAQDRNAAHVGRSHQAQTAPGPGAPKMPHLMQSEAANSGTNPSRNYGFGGFQSTSSTSVQHARNFGKLGQVLSQSAKGHRNVGNSKLNRQAGPANGTEPATTSRGNLADQDDWQPEPAEDDFDDGPAQDVNSRILAARDRDATAARQASSAANKENVRKETSRPKRRLLDAQDGATRVPDYEDMDSNNGFSQETGHNQGREEIGEADQPGPKKKLQFTDFSREEEEEGEEEEQDVQSSGAEASRTTGTAVPRSLADVNSRRRQHAHKEYIHNKPQAEAQTRRPWTPEEENQLVALIEMNGISWAQLKAIDGDGILKNRDQVALKDKARNLKMDYLKTNGILPRNFYRVKIQQSFIDRLESMGIIYDTTTGDRADRLPPTP